MANFREVNKAIKATYPDKDITLFRGVGYAYFMGADGEEIPSLYVHPVNTTTDNLILWALQSIEVYS